MIFTKTIEYKGVTLKSNLEYFFYLYLEELQDAGFVKEFSYETTKFELSKPVYLPYRKQLKTKIKDDSEFIIRECTYQPDFTIEWLEKAKNVFYLDRNEPISITKDKIPFRLSCDGSMLSYIEIKPMNESKLNSSVEFPAMQKWVYQKYNIFVQKVKPYDSYSKGSLFEKTFVPKKVVLDQIYKVNTKNATKGDTKIRYKVNTLEEYLKSRL